MVFTVPNEDKSTAELPPPLHQIEVSGDFGSEGHSGNGVTNYQDVPTIYNTLADTLNWIRQKSAARLSTYHDRWELAETLSPAKLLPPDGFGRITKKITDKRKEAQVSLQEEQLDLLSSFRSRAKGGDVSGNFIPFAAVPFETVETDTLLCSKVSSSDKTSSYSTISRSKIYRTSYIWQGLRLLDQTVGSAGDAVDLLQSNLVKMSQNETNCRKRVPHSSVAGISIYDAMGQNTNAIQSDLISHKPTIRLTEKCSYTTDFIFDPTLLEGSKRAAAKATKRAREEACAEAKARQLRTFKARPLPLGRPIKNDIYALTKVTRTRKELIAKERLRPANPNELNINKSPKASDEVPRQRSSSKIWRTRLLEEIDSRIRNEMNNLPVAMRGIITGEDLASFESDVGNTSSLEQDIASLEAQLKHKHELCRNTIDEIEALCPDNDNTMNGLGLSGLLCAVRNAKMETGEEPRRISLCCKCDKDTHQKRDLVFKKQARGTSQFGEKQGKNRLRSVKHTMAAFPGKSLRTSTDRSWQRTKSAHDIAARFDKEKNNRRMKEHKARQVLLERQKVQDGKKEKEKSSKTVEIKERDAKRDDTRQLGYTETLARPRNIIERKVDRGQGYKKDSNNVPSGDVHQARANVSDSETFSPRLTRARDKEPNSSCPDFIDPKLSFADMDDRQFGKIMKRYGISPQTRTKGQENKSLRREKKRAKYGSRLSTWRSIRSIADLGNSMRSFATNRSAVSSKGQGIYLKSISASQ